MGLRKGSDIVSERGRKCSDLQENRDSFTCSFIEVNS